MADDDLGDDNIGRLYDADGIHDRSYGPQDILLHAVSGNMAGVVSAAAALQHSGMTVDEPRNGWSETALRLAAEGGHLDIAAYLLSAGANPNARNTLGSTATMAAAECGVNMLRLMLAFGGDPRVANSDGYNALFWAVEARQTACVELLVGLDGVTPVSAGGASRAPPAVAHGGLCKAGVTAAEFAGSERMFGGPDHAMAKLISDAVSTEL